MTLSPSIFIPQATFLLVSESQFRFVLLLQISPVNLLPFLVVLWPYSPSSPFSSSNLGLFSVSFLRLHIWVSPFYLYFHIYLEWSFSESLPFFRPRQANPFRLAHWLCCSDHFREPSKRQNWKTASLPTTVTALPSSICWGSVAYTMLRCCVHNDRAEGWYLCQAELMKKWETKRGRKGEEGPLMPFPPLRRTGNCLG